MNKICTSIKQSKKLIELGIDIYTADMYWKNGISDKYIQCFTPFVCGDYQDGLDFDYDIPAWSLSALMELMNRNCYNVSLNCNGAEWTVKFDDSEKYKDFTKDYAIDAVFEMVVWLLENKKI